MKAPSDSSIDRDKQCIDALTTELFRIFSPTPGATVSLQRIHDLFIPQGIIVRTCGPNTEVFSISEFIAPRERIAQRWPPGGSLRARGMGNYRNLRKCSTAVPRVPQDGSAARGTVRHSWHADNSIRAKGWRVENVCHGLGRRARRSGYSRASGREAAITPNNECAEKSGGQAAWGGKRWYPKAG